ncbi:MAG: proliferating cell nuclear antigen (pcna) [Candidatus Diapherotrites archaeon CG11_big_fil_rev_8_21_14_0_20_37_9]|nr:MAG: proliferating cell nuclear antigen (pcna) [Candidatus Diapherotrites archaeon CG11_big_fil_rev_8_21_14_0_20_37_9]
MELFLEDATSFKKLVDGVAVLVSEAEFIISKEGLSLKATDPSQISLVDFNLPKKAFKEYKVDEELKIGVDLNYFNQVLSRAKAKDSLHLVLESDKSKLNVSFVGASKRTFSVPLVDISQAELPLPKIDFDASIEMHASVLQDSLKDAALVSTHIILAVENDSFVVKANSSKGNLENIFSQSDDKIVSLKANQETRAMFPLDYLVSVVKAASSDTLIKLSLKSNAPVEISYSVGEGSLKYFLAPRIESD